MSSNPFLCKSCRITVSGFFRYFLPSTQKSGLPFPKTIDALIPMPSPYDTHYQTPDLFGKAYPELMAFYQKIDPKGPLLDLGCGQGRDAIPLARMGFEVTAIDNSEVGIAQLNAQARAEKLPLKGRVADMHTYQDFGEFAFILLDSMFHFGKKEREQEIGLLNRIFDLVVPQTLVTICIQDSGNKVETLRLVYEERPDIVREHQQDLQYIFEDAASGHRSVSAYQMISLRKLGLIPSSS